MIVLLKIALYSDIITTVSETYAQEMQDSEYGYGLENLQDIAELIYVRYY